MDTLLDIFGWYCSFSLAAGVMMLLWGYSDIWIVKFYRRFAPKKMPDRYLCYRPEAEKTWVIWVAAFLIACPVINLIAGGLIWWGNYKRRKDEEHLADERIALTSAPPSPSMDSRYMPVRKEPDHRFKPKWLSYHQWETIKHLDPEAWYDPEEDKIWSKLNPHLILNMVQATRKL
jgi:hypothetical protein